MAVLAGLAVIAPFASALPLVAAWPLSMVMAGLGARQLRGYLRQPRRQLLVSPTLGLQVDGVPVLAARLDWRGPLAFLSWQRAGGRGRERLAWWPDTLPRAARRELRLAAGEGPVSPAASEMAP